MNRSRLFKLVDFFYKKAVKLNISDSAFTPSKNEDYKITDYEPSSLLAREDVIAANPVRDLLVLLQKKSREILDNETAFRHKNINNIPASQVNLFRQKLLVGLASAARLSYDFELSESELLEKMQTNAKFLKNLEDLLLEANTFAAKVQIVHLPKVDLLPSPSKDEIKPAMLKLVSDLKSEVPGNLGLIPLIFNFINAVGSKISTHLPEWYHKE